jgi:nucleolar MIF4G domain-containing protein 1
MTFKCRIIYSIIYFQPSFNPFYSELAIKLGGFDRKYRMAVQCCIWDRIRDIATLKKHEQNNLAKFASHLIKEKLLSLTCLKVIEFSELNKNLVKFIKHILLDLMSEPDTKLMAAPFLVVAGYPKLSVFRDGLRLFMRHFMLKHADKNGENKEELKMKVEAADMALMAGEKRLVL